MPTRHLPTTPNLDHLKNQAKKLVKDHRAGQVEAFTRIKASFPRSSGASVHEILATDFTLCNAQLVISREYGFTTWKELVEAVIACQSSSFVDGFIQDNPSLRWVQAELARISTAELPVLITGEPGTGKGLVARTIHRASTRKDGPFIQVNCDVAPEILAESEIFGHEEGAFTGARSRKLGKIEVYQGGTLFLDEIGKLSRTAQAKVARLLEQGTYERHGGTEVLEANPRVIAATSRDLQQMVSLGTFQEDLAFLLQKLQLQLPPLRERQEDIPLLTTHFAEKMAVHLKSELPQFQLRSAARSTDL